MFVYSLSLVIHLDKGTPFPHKHTELCVISLVNTKDLTKILANHIQTY